VPLPTLVLAPDVVDYAQRRGFYGAYRDVAGDEWAVDWSQAAAQLDALFGDESERERRVERAMALSARVHAHRDGRNAERVYRAILAGTAAHARPREGNG
jgi:CDP-glycerol glycerophosphotransferase (TagB/SpsB family)